MVYDVSYTALLFWGILGLISFIIGFPGNILSLSYYARKKSKKNITSIIYMIMNSVDATLCLFGLLIAVSDLFEITVFVDNVVFCQFFGVGWFTFEKFSIFVVLLLNICRTFSLYLPFRIISRRYIFIYTIFLTSFTLLYHTIGYWYGELFVPYHSRCNIILITIFDIRSPEFKAYFGTLVIFFHIIPFMLMGICLIMSAVKIARSSKKSRRQSLNSVCSLQKKKRATTTIMILGAVYFILNIPYNALHTVNMVWVLMDWKGVCPLVKLRNDIEKYAWKNFTYFVYVHSIIFNSTVNIVMCFYRTQKLRDYLVSCIYMDICKSVSGQYKAIKLFLFEMLIDWTS